MTEAYPLHWPFGKPRTKSPQRSRFDVLGVKPDATDKEIEASYRQKAKICHPDRGGSAEAMQRLNDARNRIKGRAA